MAVLSDQCDTSCRALCSSFLLVGRFEFPSNGSRIIISGLIGGLLCTEYGIVGLIIGCACTSIFLGVLTGVINKIARIPSLVVTIGLTMIFEVLGHEIIGTMNYVRIEAKDSILAEPPYIIIVFIITAVLFYIINKKTRFSYQTRAVGSNEVVANNMGINSARIKYITFIVGAIFLTIASILQISLSSVIAPQINLASTTYIFKPLMGVMVGLAIEPFCDLAIGILIGEFSINIIFIGLISAGLPDTFQNIMLGLFLILVMVFSENKAAISQYIKNQKSKRKSEKVLS